MLMKGRFFHILFLLIFVSAFFAGCEESQVKSPYPREQTLYVGGFDWATPETFNPFIGDPNFPIDGNVRLLYESLFAYNQLSGKLEPMLAESFTATDSSVLVVLDKRAHWNDGAPVTVEDVIYTFYLDSILPTPRQGGWEHLSHITASGDTLEFHYREGFGSLPTIFNMLSETSILPKHKLHDMIEGFKNKNGTYNADSVWGFKNDRDPVGSGPYKLKGFNKEQIILERDDNYWGNVKHGGKAPAPKFIIHSIYSSNNLFNNAMTRGNMDISSVFLPRIQTKDRDSIRAWSLEPPYHLPGAIVTLLLNHEREPFSDVEFRRALSHLVDFEKIRDRAISGYSPKIRPGLVLPFGNEAIFFDETAAQKFGNQFDPELAKKILLDAGYGFSEKGELLLKDGKPLAPLKIECPKGWTDWEDVIMVLTGSFRAAGIPAEDHFVDYAEWERNLRYGTFDLSVKTQTADLSMSTPWIRFRQLLYSKALPDDGRPAFANHGRYRNAEVDSIIEQIPGIAGDTAKMVKEFKKLNFIVMQDVPVIPLFYKPTQYYQFSTKHWTNFPTEENPYAPPANLITAAGVKALWEIRPRGK